MTTRKKIEILIYLTELISIAVLISFLLKYNGIYQVGGFLSVSLVSIFSTNRIFKDREHKRFKFRASVMMISSLIVLLVLVCLKPNYSFEESLNLVIDENPATMKSNYIEYKHGQNTIPLYDEEKSIFYAKRAYYYRFLVEDKYIYFMVHPTSGVVKEINGYWGDDE